MSRHPATASIALDRRIHPRTALARPVRLQVAGCEEVVAVSANLSPGGLFVKTPEPPSVGTRVRFVIDLEERAVRGYAEVAWIRARFGGVERPRGMGLRFVFILDGGGRYLDEYIAAAERR